MEQTVYEILDEAKRELELYQAVVDLLEICGNIGEYIGIDCDTIAKIGNARAALAKAAGEAENDY